MRKLVLLSGGTMFLALALSLTSFKAMPPEKASVNGQGSLTVNVDQQRRFSFHANTMPDGSVKGSGVLTYTGGELKIKFDINCMTVTGNQAILSGIITSHDETPALVGTGCWFKIVDNGEGANSAGDQMTLLSVGLAPGFPCNLTIGNNPLRPIEGGNIQVKP